MAKPIVLITIPRSENLSKEQLVSIAPNVQTQLQNEYYVLVTTDNITEIKFQVLYEKDFTEVNFEELKAIIENSLK